MASAQSSTFIGRTAWARNLATPVRDFLSTETGSAKAWRLVEAELAQHDFIAGDTFTLCDIPWGVHANRWFGMDYLGLARPELPALRKWYDRLCQRPAYQQHIVAVPIA